MNNWSLTMKGHISLDKLKTKKGESSLLVIILMSGLIVLIVLPLVAIIFDKGLVRLAAQDITDQIDINTYLIYQTIDFKALSHQSLKEDGQLLNLFNEALNIRHPQVKEIEVTNVLIENEGMYLSISIQLIPTLYRYVYDLSNTYNFEYYVGLPLDGL